MKKKRVLLNVFIICFGSAVAQHHGTVHKATIPAYRVLVTESGKAMSARDWAGMKTMKMQEALNLNGKQAERLYKVNLCIAKDTRSRHAGKQAAKEKQTKKLAKREKKFTQTLSPSQLAAYGNWKKQSRAGMDVKPCKMKGHGKRMIISCHSKHPDNY